MNYLLEMQASLLDHVWMFNMYSLYWIGYVSLDAKWRRWPLESCLFTALRCSQSETATVHWTITYHEQTNVFFICMIYLWNFFNSTNNINTLHKPLHVWMIKTNEQISIQKIISMWKCLSYYPTANIKNKTSIAVLFLWIFIRNYFHNLWTAEWILLWVIVWLPLLTTCTYVLKYHLLHIIINIYINYYYH